MDLTNVIASVVGLQQYSRPGHSDIYHDRTRQRGCRLFGLLSYGKSIYSNGGLKDIVLQSKVLLGPSLNLKKNIIPEGCTLGKFR